MQIVYEDDNIIVVHKEAGEPTQTARSVIPDLVSKLKVYLSQSSVKKAEPYLGVIHRLDQPVEGLLVFAKNKTAAAELSRQVQTSLMNKIYTAKVHGILEDTGKCTLKNYIYKDVKESKAIVISDAMANKNKDAKQAELSYEVLEVDRSNNTTALRIYLKTGRFHQIRAQLSNLGYPIVGDVKYGGEKSSQKGICLCASELEFVHPLTRKRMNFTV